MAVLNEDGKIVIDLDAANRDIRNLRQIKEGLENALTQMMSIQADNYGQQGPTAESIETLSETISVVIRKQIASLDTTINYINSTISKYQTIDSESAEAINQTL